MINKKITISLVILIGFWSQPVMAYIDPGSGSAIMSAIIGIFVAGGMFIKTYWYKLKAFFSGSKRNDDENTDSQDDQAGN